ncbi:Hypothetical protein CINCED_3A025415 [Cinara cedri]|uniref:DUF4485 domain-containing protein n=1 Tax=Cinara cedri TaxID=506608 RepID=A0A5E4MRI6_9HEMI|nr:Hypothetical protein CINCED_3A025415 [Cinara cedri]
MTSRFECIPRKIKRITSHKDDNLESRIQQTYNFYRTIIHPSILRLNNEKEKLNYALWLSRLDNERHKERQIHFIKIVFISLKRNHPFYIFLNPPPEDLTELNLGDENTVETIEILHNSDTKYSLLNDETILQKTKFKRFAAVATDMNSYATVKISKYLAQSFYVMSDFPINIWYNPTNIATPNNLDHNDWELFLNHFDIVSKGKTAIKHQNNCEDIMKLDQVSKEGANSFVWHPHSVLKDCHRPKRSAGFDEIDVNISNQQLTQQQIDESAFSIVHKKTFPGYKILNPRIYSTTLMPNPEFVFNTTGVKITYNKTPRILNKNDQKVQDEKSACFPLKQQKSESSCGNNDDKTNIKSVCNRSTQNSNNCQKSSINTTQAQTPRVKAGNSSDLELNKTYTCNLSHGNGPSFSLKLLSKSLDSENSRMKHKLRNVSCHNKQCQEGKHLNQTNNNQPTVENDQSNVSNSHSSLLNDSSNYEWTMSSNEMSMDQNTVPIDTGTNRSPHHQSHQTRRMPMENQNDQLSNVRSSNQNSRKNKKCHNDEHHTYHEHGEQKSRHNKTNVSSHLNRTQNKECRNGSNRSNNTSQHHKIRPRSSSVPSYSNRAYKNGDAKTEKPLYENKNNSRPPYEESNKNKISNISNDNMNKSVMPNLNCKRNDTMCSPRYYDSWDIDVGNYSEFLENCKSRTQDQSMQCRSSLNKTSNFQSVLSESFESTSSSDWSETSKCDALNSYNSSDSLSTLTTTGSSSDEDHQPNRPPIYPIRSDYRQDLTPDLNRFNGTRRLDGINFDKRFNESTSMDSEGYDFTNEGISCPFDNTQHLDSPNFNLHNITRREDEINYNNTFTESTGPVSEGHNFTNEGNSRMFENLQQSDPTVKWPISDQNYQDIEEFDLSYTCSDWEHLNSDDDFSRNDVEDTNSSQAVYQQRRLQDWSFRESDLRNTSMPELSYDTNFSDYNDSMDDDESSFRKN